MKKQSTILIRYLFLFVCMYCASCSNPVSDSSESSPDSSSGTPVVINDDYAPLSVLNKTLTIDNNGPHTMIFKTSSSCSLPYYTITNNYSWNEHPAYKYKYHSTNFSTVNLQYTLIATTKSTTLKIKYNYDFFLTFTGKTYGTFKANMTRTNSISIGGNPSSSSGSIDSFSGSFSIK